MSKSHFLVSGIMCNRSVPGPQSLVHIISLTSNGRLNLQLRRPVRSRYSSRCAVHALSLPSGVRQICWGSAYLRQDVVVLGSSLTRWLPFLSRVGGHMVGCGRWLKNHFPPSRRMSLRSGSRPQWSVPLGLQRSVLLLKPFVKHLCEHVTAVCPLSFVLKYLCLECTETRGRDVKM